MNKKKVGIIIGVVVIAAAAAAGIWYYIGHNGKDSKDRVYVEKVSTIMETSMGEQNRYSGVVQPQKTIEINTDSDRTVKEVYVKVGDMVEEGTPLFCYDTDELTMDLEQAKLEMENIDVDISNYKNQISELEKEKNAAAEGDKFEYTTQIQTIQTSIKQSEFEKSSKKLNIEKIQKSIDNSEVLSTASGVVKTLNDANSQDGGDSSSAFMTILATGAYRVKGTINEQNVNSIMAGADVIVRSRVDESITWKGTIDTIDTGDPSSSSSDDMGMMGDGDDSTSSSKYPFYVSLEDAEGLMLGQHVIIELDEGQTEPKEGLWLYSSYIVWDDEDMPEDMEYLDTEYLDTEYEETEELESVDMEMDTEAMVKTAYVWADNGNHRLEKRPIEVGEYDEGLDEYEIISGLSEDDLIAWPMEGLYEGIITVTDMDEIDYSSGLYNQGDTEEWDTEWYDTEFEDEGFRMEDYSGMEGMPLEDSGLQEGDLQDAEVSE